MSHLVTDLVTAAGDRSVRSAQFVLAERVGFEPTKLSLGGFQVCGPMLSRFPMGAAATLGPDRVRPDLVTDLVTP